MTSGRGPIQASLHSFRTSAKWAFSARKAVAGMDGVGAGDLGGEMMREMLR